MLCRRAEPFIIRSERIDDSPVISGVAKQLQLAEVLERPLGTHGLQQGVSNGWLEAVRPQQGPSS